MSSAGAGLVLAAGVEGGEDHQVGQGEEQVVRLLARRLRGARDKPDVAGARKLAKMRGADARQGGGLRVREDLLARLDLNHVWLPIHLTRAAANGFDDSAWAALALGRCRRGATARAIGLFVALLVQVGSIRRRAQACNRVGTGVLGWENANFAVG